MIVFLFLLSRHLLLDVLLISSCFVSPQSGFYALVFPFRDK